MSANSWIRLCLVIGIVTGAPAMIGTVDALAYFWAGHTVTWIEWGERYTDAYRVEIAASLGVFSAFVLTAAWGAYYMHLDDAP